MLNIWKLKSDDFNKSRRYYYLTKYEKNCTNSNFLKYIWKFPEEFSTMTRKSNISSNFLHFSLFIVLNFNVKP